MVASRRDPPRRPRSRTSSSSAAVGSGGLGREPSGSSRSACTPSSSSRSALPRRATSCIAAIASRGVLAGLLRRRDGLRGGVLLRLEPLDLGQQLAPARVELEHAVQPGLRAVAAPRERGADAARDRRGWPSGRARGPCAAAAACGGALLATPAGAVLAGATARGLAARVLRQEVRHRLCLARRPRCPAASVRRRTRRCGSRRGWSLLLLACVEVRTVLVLAVVRLERRALRARGVERVAARAVLLSKISAPR